MDRAELFRNLSEKNFNPMNDVIFKFIFGKEERKSITIDFLNAVLEQDLGHKIENIEFLPTEMIPGNEHEKLTRLDVACTLDSGEQVDVEVQVVNYQDMQRRTLFYWAQMYLSILAPGITYQDLHPVITINILKFKLLPQEEPYSMWSIYNPVTGDRLNRDLTLHFLEIPKFKKKPVKDMTRMERWLAYFANKLNQEEKEELVMSEAAIKDAMTAARLFFNNPAERNSYISREIATMDYNSNMRGAKEEGEAVGIKKGEDRLSNLIQRLFADHRAEDVLNVTKDKELRERLYREYGIQ